MAQYYAESEIYIAATASPCAQYGFFVLGLLDALQQDKQVKLRACWCGHLLRM